MTEAKARALVWWAIILFTTLFWYIVCFMILPKYVLAQEESHIVPADVPFTLNWTESTGSPDGYEVEKAQGAGAFVHSVDVVPTTHVDQLSDLTSARYRVRAFHNEKVVDGVTIPKQVGEYSDPSNRIIGVTLPGKPGKPGLQ